MNKTEFISAVSAKLHEVKAKRPVTFPKQKIFIRDGDGNETSLILRQQDRMIGYNVEDVRYIVDAMIEVTKDALRSGEEISIYGFGTLMLHYRAARRTRTTYKNSAAFDEQEWCLVKERHVPKFRYGTELRKAALAYDRINEERAAAAEEKIEPVYDEYDDIDLGVLLNAED